MENRSQTKSGFYSDFSCIILRIVVEYVKEKGGFESTLGFFHNELFIIIGLYFIFTAENQ
jgi:hypothetical protein